MRMPCLRVKCKSIGRIASVEGKVKGVFVKCLIRINPVYSTQPTITSTHLSTFITILLGEETLLD